MPRVYVTLPVRCSTCDAGADEPCRGFWGRVRGVPHRTRLALFNAGRD